MRSEELHDGASEAFDRDRASPSLRLRSAK